MEPVVATGVFFALLALLAPWFGADTRRSGGWDSLDVWEEVMPRPRPRRRAGGAAARTSWRRRREALPPSPRGRRREDCAT